MTKHILFQFHNKAEKDFARLMARYNCRTKGELIDFAITLLDRITRGIDEEGRIIALLDEKSGDYTEIVLAPMLD